MRESDNLRIISYNVCRPATTLSRISFFKLPGFTNSALALFEKCKNAQHLGTNLKQDLENLHPHLDSDVNKAFQSYKNYHGRNYKDKESEVRKLIFEDNWRRIVHHNRKNLGYKLEVNKFADRFDEELVHTSGTWPSDPSDLGTELFPFSEEELKAMEEELPNNYDIRQDGVISSIKSKFVVLCRTMNPTPIFRP
ncbi:unnamed protein product [Parnassius apollo]|uniref:(apollo) hypothetical protein n=1 Tax=Parnassius apollo TaxID=110799 RepID=A0A8S3XWB5_PARAO|nr:unnamed protein product [Parnassius apollo]